MPTATWKSRLRSGSAHCDLEVAVEVRQCPLGSGARGGGPAVPTGIWTARRRRRRRWRRRRTALINLKSNNPHLAGGEKTLRLITSIPISMNINGYFVDGDSASHMVQPRVVACQALQPVPRGGASWPWRRAWAMDRRVYCDLC